MYDQQFKQAGSSIWWVSISDLFLPFIYTDLLPEDKKGALMSFIPYVQWTSWLHIYIHVCDHNCAQAQHA